jgi:HSP20 family protein
MSEKVPKESSKHRKVKAEPFGEIMRSVNDLFQEKPVKGLLQSMDEFFRTPFPLSTLEAELKESDKEYVIRVELPGVKKEQINIDIVGTEIVISIQNEELSEIEDNSKQVVRRRHSRQRGSRSFTFPYTINEKYVKAKYNDGLLLIRIQKQKGKNVLIE